LSKDWPYHFGIEEEFFLTRLDDGNVAQRMPARLYQQSRVALGARVSHELLQSQIETATGICESPAQAAAELAELRQGLNRVAAGFGYGLVASGTHPLAEWREQAATDKPRYEQLMSDFQIIAQRNLMCGLHVHVGIPDGMDRVMLMNRILPWLPLFLALSTSSPFWSRKRTGMMSYRQAAYDEWPRTGIPDHFPSERSYEAFVDLLVELGSLQTASSLWWAIRPSPRFPTLELRISDACTDPADAVCIAGLLRSLIRAAVLDPSLGASRNEMTRLLIEENRWRAKRHGLQATFIDQQSRRVLTASDWMESLFAVIAEHAQALGCEAAIDRARVILADGTSAHRQLAVYRAQRDAGSHRRPALQSVVQHLLAETANV
jgi:glutamate---cysteine ligase / carboxylate-amine ligase